MKILIICGHGAGDPGACTKKYQEASLVREMGPKLKAALAPYADVTLFDTTKNMFKHLNAGNPFNFKVYDYVIELHFNSCVKDFDGNGYTTGTEILVHDLEKGITVEKAILKNIVALGFTDRGVKKRSDLLVMNRCKKSQGISHALVETCFIDDADDMKVYNKNKDAVVNAIAQGIITGFKLKAKQPIVATPADTSYKVKVNTGCLLIRKAPRKNSACVGRIEDKGTYTIVEEQPGYGSTAGWGLLKSYKKNRDGWISLDYCIKK